MRIQGNTYTAEVTRDERLKVDASMKHPASAANDSGNAYVVHIDVTPEAADVFFYLKNKDERPLKIYKIDGFCVTTNEEVSCYTGATDDGQFSSGDTLTPLNLNTGYPAADVECVQDATDLAPTGGSVAALLKMPATTLERAVFEFPEGIIINRNQRFHMEVAGAAAVVNFSVYFYFE